MLFTDTAHGCFAKDPSVVKFHGMYYLYYSTAVDRVENGAVNTGMKNARGSSDGGQTWYLSKTQLLFDADGFPVYSGIRE